MHQVDDDGIVLIERTQEVDNEALGKKSQSCAWMNSGSCEGGMIVGASIEA